MIPTAYFRQHHAVEAAAIDERRFRPYWRVTQTAVTASSVSASAISKGLRIS
jgi:hypothetical protein